MGKFQCLRCVSFTLNFCLQDAMYKPNCHFSGVLPGQLATNFTTAWKRIILSILHWK